eukprot:GHVT01087774.1.p1 GENE.GHVT01087774.1~~GHVT01087774.1.p1  ORF type:complete len:488 (+),score=63.78 GHVT01087774.1:2553-4016(+)
MNFPLSPGSFTPRSAAVSRSRNCSWDKANDIPNQSKVFQDAMLLFGRIAEEFYPEVPEQLGRSRATEPYAFRLIACRDPPAKDAVDCAEYGEKWEALFQAPSPASLARSQPPNSAAQQPFPHDYRDRCRGGDEPAATDETYASNETLPPAPFLRLKTTNGKQTPMLRKKSRFFQALGLAFSPSSDLDADCTGRPGTVRGRRLHPLRRLTTPPANPVLLSREQFKSRLLDTLLFRWPLHSDGSIVESKTHSALVEQNTQFVEIVTPDESEIKGLLLKLLEKSNNTEDWGSQSSKALGGKAADAAFQTIPTVGAQARLRFRSCAAARQVVNRAFAQQVELSPFTFHAFLDAVLECEDRHRLFGKDEFGQKLKKWILACSSSDNGHSYFDDFASMLLARVNDHQKNAPHLPPTGYSTSSFSSGQRTGDPTIYPLGHTQNPFRVSRRKNEAAHSAVKLRQQWRNAFQWFSAIFRMFIAKICMRRHPSAHDT